MISSDDPHTVIALNGGFEGECVEDTKLRVITAVELAKTMQVTGTLGRLIMAGADSREMFKFAEVYHAKKFPITEALPIEYDNNSKDTIGNAHFTKTRRNLSPIKEPNIDVVTVNWHTVRSGWTFKQVLGPRFNVKTDSSPNPYNQLQTAKRIGVEIAAFGLALRILHGVKPDDDEQRESRLLKIHQRYKL